MNAVAKRSRPKHAGTQVYCKSPPVSTRPARNTPRYRLGLISRQASMQNEDTRQ
jgi:hypothetical protein